MTDIYPNHKVKLQSFSKYIGRKFDRCMVSRVLQYTNSQQQLSGLYHHANRDCIYLEAL